MMKKENSKYPKVHPAMVAVWAALVSICGFLPTFPVIGGGNFSISYVIAPLAGIFFGPWTGALAVAIGELIASFITPHVANLGIFTFVGNTLNTFAAGYICRKNWKVGAGIIGLLTIVWFLMPGGRAGWVYGAVVYPLGLIMCPIGGILGTRLLNSEGIKRFIGMFLIAWPSFIAGSTINNIVTLLIVDIPPELWNTYLVWVTPMERTIFSVGTAIIGIPLLVGLPKISVYVGPQYDNIEASNDLDRQMEEEAAKKRK